MATASAALVLLGGCSGDQERVFDAEPRVVSAPGEKTSPSPSDLAQPMSPGTVELSPGVFTDVLRLDRAELVQGRRPVLTAQLGNLVDAAPLLQLEVQARFYDRDGRYLGDAVYVEEGHGEEDHGDEGPEEHDGEQYDVLPMRLSPESPLPSVATSSTLHVVQFVTE